MSRTLTERTAARDPIVQFRRWFRRAVDTVGPDAHVMTLATVGAGGRPSARTVLLKHVDGRGFVFHTNQRSRKGRELAANPRACLVFYWAPLGRQVRIEGSASPIAADESDAYFGTRPRGSQLSAWASPQSRRVGSRRELEHRAAVIAARFAGRTVPRPPYWGGYRLVPDRMEFWQSRVDRMHDRLVYRRGKDNIWLLTRLAP